MSGLLSVLAWLAEVEGYWSVLRFTGLPFLARRTLKKLRGPMMTAGLEFFPTRGMLDLARSFDEILARAEKIDAAYLGGGKMAEQDIANIRHIQRLILPDPRSESLRGYAISIGNAPELIQHIIRTTQQAREKYGIEVKWYPFMYHASFMIGDADRNHGWAHVELTLPFSTPNRRPSFTISKVRNEDAVAGIVHVFEQMWSASKPPDEDYLAEQGARPIFDVGDL